MLALDGVHVSYGPTTVLRGVTFSVPAQSIVALLGGNGSGKSTTLNTVSGFITPRDGTITFDGHRIDGLGTHTIVKAGLVQVPQGREVFARLTVQENLELGAVVRHDPREVREDVATLCARFPRLAERRKQLAGTLSGGEQQMLAIARALMARPRMMLLDEPSAGLSPVMVEEVCEVIRQLQGDGMTCLIVEQNVGAALGLASVAYVLRDGVVALHGDARDLLHSADVVRAYLG